MGLSKKQQKKAAKRAAYEADKPARRAREKEARRQKNAIKRASGQPIHPNKRRRRLPAVGSSSNKPEFKATLGVDLGGWDALMREREVVSMVSQLCYCYNISRHASHRFLTQVYQFEGRVKERMGPQGALKGVYESWTKQADIEFKEERLGEVLDLGKVVYLTADSENVLERLEEGEVYVLGGIVDKNRYKVRVPSIVIYVFRGYDGGS